MTPLHMIADALGVPRAPAPQPCVVCGGSPFKPSGWRLPASFSDHDMMRAPGAGKVCAGCKEVLGGHPSRQPPPLRSHSFVVVGGELRPLAQSDWWEWLSEPPPGPLVASWAQGRKRHHALRAGVSGQGTWRVGADNRQLEWRHDPDLPAAVQTLRRLGMTKGQIMTGRYSMPRLAAAGELGRQAEEIAAPYRGRGVLDLIVYASPAPENKTEEIDEMPMSKADDTAVRLLTEIAEASAVRRADGLYFWGRGAREGFFLSRVRRMAHLPLLDLVSRLMEICMVGATHGAATCKWVAAMDEDEERAVCDALQRRPAALAAMAFDRRRAAVTKEQKT